MEAPPPEPDDAAPPLGAIVLSHVNAGLEFVDDLASDDEQDSLVEQMNLHGNNIQMMDGLEAFTGLVELCLSSNYIEEIAFHSLQPLLHLRVLDLSANSISSTLGFPQLPRLEELSMAHNCLQCLEGLVRPIKFPKLRYLDLRGNEIAGFNDVISLQRLKRLSHLRLQAADGSQANPICDLDDYQHAIIKMLPNLELLDEEEVEFLKEMGSLHMPKYRSLMRRIVDSKRADRYHGKSPRDRRRESSLALEHNVRERGQENRQPSNRMTQRRAFALPPKLQVIAEPDDTRRFGNGNPVQKERSSVENAKREDSPVPQMPPPPPPLPEISDYCKPERIVVKDCGTNTEVDVEKDVLQREQIMAKKETEILEKEKIFLSRENEFYVKEKGYKNQIASLQEELEDAKLRATKAESTVLEMSNHWLQKEKEHVVAGAATDEGSDAIQEAQNKKDEWEAALARMEESHKGDLEQFSTEKDKLEGELAALKETFTAASQKLQGTEESLQQQMVVVEKLKAKVDDTTRELELARKSHEAAAAQLSDEVRYHKDRCDEADKRNLHLEKQVAELKANVETVYNKCIEKDDAVQHLKRSLVARQEELEALRLQYGKDSERQDKLQQQQQDLYERQLQASIIQVEMEFRKEHQQSSQKFQSLQRKTQERLKEIKRVREAYQKSLHREAVAKAEIEKLQAILEDDKKKLFVEDVKRSDAFKAEIRSRKEKYRQLEEQLAEEQKKSAQVAVLSGELDENQVEIERLQQEIQHFEQQQDKWKKLEDDLRAALKVKDVMLADQQRQIKELGNHRRQSEGQFNDEIAVLQAQIEDIEAALDESLQKCADEEVENEKLTAKITELEEDVPEKEKQLRLLAEELEQKVSALEFIDQEMQRMRTALEDQDTLFQKRLQKHLEQQREEVERVRAGAEEERELQIREWEAERSEMMRKYEVLASEMKDIAAQNTQLRTALDQERRRNAQNDRDTRILLAQIDRERQAKKENLRQIKSLFEQLQKEGS